VVHAVNSESLAEKRGTGQWGWMFNPMHLWVSLRDRFMIGGLRYRKFVAVSARVSDELQKHYHVPPERISIIPNGIDVDRFRPDPAARHVIRKEFGIPETAKLLLFAGHEFRRKGLAPAIGALERLGPDVWMLVVGSDHAEPYRKLAVKAKDRLVFAGARLDMPALYAAADAFLLPTAYETFSLVCMEAMSSAVPVFATRVGGIEDYLDDGVNGYGITFDPEDIADKIGRAFADEAALERMRAGARATALRYRWDQVASKYIEMMGQIQAAKSGRTVTFKAAA
jgi:glycosyltransferase involved in cell wall biosynthesis